MTVDRLAEEGDGTGRLCTLADSLFGKGGNEDDRYVRTAYGQRVLELHSIHSWHLHVGDDARGIIQLGRGQELLRGREHARLVAERPNEAAHCSSDGLVIVDDGDDRSGRQNIVPCDGSAIENGCRANMARRQRLQSHTDVYCRTPFPIQDMSATLARAPSPPISDGFGPKSRFPSWPDIMLHHPTPHFEGACHTETGGGILIVQYPGPSIGGRLIYAGTLQHGEAQVTPRSASTSETTGTAHPAP